MRAENTSLRATFASGLVGSAEEAMARNFVVIDGGMRAASSGVDARYAAICVRGRNPHIAVNGVSANAISGLWFASAQSLARRVTAKIEGDVPL